MSYYVLKLDEVDYDTYVSSISITRTQRGAKFSPKVGRAVAFATRAEAKFFTKCLVSKLVVERVRT